MPSAGPDVLGFTDRRQHRPQRQVRHQDQPVEHGVHWALEIPLVSLQFETLTTCKPLNQSSLSPIVLEVCWADEVSVRYNAPKIVSSYEVNGIWRIRGNGVVL